MTGRPGQGGRPAGRSVSAGPSSWGAALAAGSLLAVLGLTACGADAAKASTVLRTARAATVVLADGSTRPATVGMDVPKGATVRTDPGGSATLVTARRTVLLGQSTAVTVIDGARERLRSGLVMIDARRSPGLTLEAGAATVTTPRGGLSRVERGALLRAASFGRTLTVRATGRRASAKVDRLYQVQVPDGGLPGAVTALALTRDTWERRYALDLVTADADLGALAAGLDRNPASSSAVLSAVPASYGGAVTVAAGEPRSESALAFVISAADRSGSARDYRRVRALRAEGGSWGVVAAIVGADVAAVAAALDATLNPTEGPAAILAGGAPTAVAPGPLLGGPPARPAPAATSGPSRPTRAPSSSPSPRPTPSSSPDPVNDVVTTVTGLLPSPSPSPSRSAAALLPLPSPSPLVSVRVGGLGVG